MEKLFGVPLPVLMMVLGGIFLAAMLVVIGMALRNTVMVKMGIRPISRRPGMTALIIVGIMLSTIIMSAAFGTADTLTFSIRDIAINGLRNIDEVIVPARAAEGDRFGQSFISMERYERLQAELADDDRIDGIMPQFTETVPAVNPAEGLSEGQFNLVGIDPSRLAGFGELQLASGGGAAVGGLADNEAFINEKAAAELELQANGELDLYVENRSVRFDVKGVVESGSFAGIASTMVISLDRAQELFGRPGQITSIAISNRGDQLSGNDLSEEVTKDLRVGFVDRQAAARLKDTLNRDAFIAALTKKRDAAADPERKAKLEALLAGLQAAGLTDDFIAALGDVETTAVAFDILSGDELRELQREAVTLYAELGELRVLAFKSDLLRAAEAAGTGVSAFFLTFSVFSIGSGILLIFLIFVLLAGARKSEMGMARAVGAKRRNLIQMFVFEGTAYALVSAAIGVVLGLAVSALMVGILNSVFSTFDDDFALQIHFTLPTIVVSYCLGMIITFATVGLSAYRVSQLNIVAAVRNLPESLVPDAPSPLSSRLFGLLRGIFRPAIFFWRALRLSVKLDVVPALLNIVFALIWLFPVVLITDVLVQLFRLVWPYLLQGWLLVVFGAALVAASISVESLQLWSLFGGGVTLVLAGIGLSARTVLAMGGMSSAVRDRIVFTATGIAILAFWGLPASVTDRLLGKVADDLGGDIDIMFVSGIAMVGAAVWTVMYNADLILRGLQVATSRFRQLRPVLVTAVAYPLSAKFRTGLTLAMFALVIFTLTIMSVLTETFGTQFAETRVITAGWDIEGSVNLTTPIEDIRSDISGSEQVQESQIEAIGGYTTIPAQVREVEGDDQEWSGVRFVAADDGYLASSAYDLKLIAGGYGSTSKEAFDAIRNDPTLVLIDGSMLSTGQGQEGEVVERVFHQVNYDDGSMDPLGIEMREPTTGAVATLTAIGVIDRIHDTGFGIGIIGSKAAIEDQAPFPIPIATYRFRVVDPELSGDVAKDLERSFLENGMDTVVLEESLDEQFGATRSILRLFTGFMALGLFVGIAALGVVSTRAVVERRQQIGMLRAIGHRRSMIQLSFMLESSFVALLGVVIGTLLGLVLSYNAVVDIRDEQGIDTITFAIPWAQMGIILGLTYLFSLLATYIPARQASKVYPAEALRYE